MSDPSATGESMPLQRFVADLRSDIAVDGADQLNVVSSPGTSTVTVRGNERTALVIPDDWSIERSSAEIVNFCKAGEEPDYVAVHGPGGTFMFAPSSAVTQFASVLGLHGDPIIRASTGCYECTAEGHRYAPHQVRYEVDGKAYCTQPDVSELMFHDPCPQT